MAKTKLSKSEFRSTFDKINKLDATGTSENEIKREESARNSFDRLE